MGNPVKDLTGIRFGRLIVLSISQHRQANGRLKWKCKCDCGNITTASSANLKSASIISCGCARIRTDLTGKTFGKVSVVSKAYRAYRNDKPYTFVDCVCECGNKFTTYTSTLQKGETKSCGCWKTGFTDGKPACLYVIHTIDFIGFGITTNLKKRMRLHRSNLAKASVSIKQIYYYKLRSASNALNLEKCIKQNLKSYLVDTGIDAFRVEALETRASKPLKRLLSNTKRKSLPYNQELGA